MVSRLINETNIWPKDCSAADKAGESYISVIKERFVDAGRGQVSQLVVPMTWRPTWDVTHPFLQGKATHMLDLGDDNDVHTPPKR